MKLYFVAFMLGYCMSALFGAYHTIEFALWIWLMLSIDHIIEDNRWRLG